MSPKQKSSYSGAALRLAREEREKAAADPAEQTRRSLENHERVIENASRSFIAAGQALLAIRSERLYSGQFSTFAEYLDSRWDVSETHANRLISAALVAIEATPIGVEINSEAVARELVGLDTEMLRQVWDEATRRAAGGRVTAGLVREVRRALERPAIDGEAVETKTSPDTAVLGDGKEGAADHRGPAAPSTPKDHTDEEPDPIARVDSSAQPEGSGVTLGSAPADLEEILPASTPAVPEQAGTGVTPPAPDPKPSPVLAWAQDSKEFKAAALRRDLHGFMEAGWKVVDQIDPGELAPFLKPQVIEDVAKFRAALDGWLAAIGDEHKQYTRPRLVKEA